jgi:hypothetical protein
VPAGLFVAEDVPQQYPLVDLATILVALSQHSISGDVLA